MTTTHERELPLATQQRLDQACNAFEQAWLAGQQPRIEEFVPEDADLELRSALLRELVLVDCHYRAKAGEALANADYQLRFPELEMAQSTNFDSRPDNQLSHEPASLPAGYELVDELGRGGMGVVYLARQVRLDRLVALKMISRGSHAGPQERLRFQLEAEAVAALQHPHIVQLHEVGEVHGSPYLVLEYIAGGTLAEQIRGKPFSCAEAARIVSALARAVDYAHRRGVLHRDLKPANVLVGSDGVPRITDFGLAKRLHGELPRDAAAGKTRTGEVLGTPSYMSPEQATGRTREIGPASDVYALGAILYEAITGSPPFKAETAVATLLQVTTQEPTPPTRLRRGVPRDLETICLKCLAKAQTERYASAESLADDLQRFLAGEPILARPVGRWERTIKWVRRQPASAALLLVSALTALALVGVLVGSWYHLQLQETHLQLRDAFAAETRATYSRQILLAQNEWQENHVDRAEELLDALPSETKGNWEWRYLKRLCHTELLTLTGHKAAVRGLAYSPDGRYLASVSPDKSVKIWNGATGQAIATLHGHENFVFSVAFSRDGRFLASGSGQGAVKVWEVGTWKPLLDLQVAAKVPSRTPKGQNIVASLAFSPDGQHLAGAYEDNKARLWRLDSGELVQTLEGHLGAVTSIAYSPDGRLLASAAKDRTIRLWEPDSGTLLRTLAGHTQGVTSIAFLPDTPRLLSGSEDQTVRLWDLSTGQQTQVFERHQRAVWSVTVSSDGDRLASASEDDSVQVWNARNLRFEFSLRGHGKHVYSVAFRPDGQQLATATHDGTIKLWDANQRSEASLLRPPGNPEEANSVAFSPDGRWLASAWNDATIRVWDMQARVWQHTLQGHTASVNGVGFSPDGRWLASASDDQTVRIWDIATGQCVSCLRGHTARVWSVVFSPDGSWLASASGEDKKLPPDANDTTVRIWQAATGRLTHVLKGHTARVSSLAFSKDGEQLASAACDHSIRLWNVRSGQEVLVIDGDRWDDTKRGRSTGRIYTVAFSPDGKLLASGSEDHHIHLWNARTGRHENAFPGRFSVWSVAFHPQGKRLASGWNDNTIRLWDLQTGVEVLALRGHTDSVNSVAFSPDGDFLASCSWDHTIRLWNATARGK